MLYRRNPSDCCKGPFCGRQDNRFFQILAEQPVRVKPKDKLLVEIRLDGSRHLRFKDEFPLY